MLLPKVLAGVERILVAGDTVDHSLLLRLEAIAPVQPLATSDANVRQLGGIASPPG